MLQPAGAAPRSASHPHQCCPHLLLLPLQVPEMSFEGAPKPEDELNELEQEARTISLQANNHIRDPQKK